VEICRGRAAEFLRHSAAHQPTSPLFSPACHQPGLFVFEILDERENFLEDKFLRRLPISF